jgi:hypothetical protein
MVARESLVSESLLGVLHDGLASVSVSHQPALCYVSHRAVTTASGDLFAWKLYFLRSVALVNGASLVGPLLTELISETLESN